MTVVLKATMEDPVSQDSKVKLVRWVQWVLKEPLVALALLVRVASLEKKVTVVFPVFLDLVAQWDLWDPTVLWAQLVNLGNQVLQDEVDHKVKWALQVLWAPKDDLVNVVLKVLQDFLDLVVQWDHKALWVLKALKVTKVSLE